MKQQNLTTQRKMPYQKMYSDHPEVRPWYCWQPLLTLGLMLFILTFFFIATVLPLVGPFLFSTFLEAGVSSLWIAAFWLLVLGIEAIFLIVILLLRKRYRARYGGEWQAPSWQPHSRRQVVRNPLYRPWRWLIVLASLPVVVGAVMSVVPHISLWLRAPADIVAFLEQAGVLLLLYFYWRFVQRQVLLWRLERRRQRLAAMTSPWRPMQRNVVSLLPFVMQYNRKSIMRIIYTGVAIIFLVACYNIFLLTPDASISGEFLLFLGSFILLLLFAIIPLSGALLYLLFSPLLRYRYMVNVSERGLAGEQAGTAGNTFVNWDEATLLISYRLPNYLPWRNTVTIYELSSPHAAVIWYEDQRPGSLFATYGVTQPPDEYHRQHQVLRELAEKRTGLELQRL